MEPERVGRDAAERTRRRLRDATPRKGKHGPGHPRGTPPPRPPEQPPH